MILKSQKRIAAQLMKTGKSRVKFDQERLDDIKESITKTDLRSLIRDKAIQAKPKKGVSRLRARKKIIQKRKGRRSNEGSRKGKRTVRLPRKKEWQNKIRLQRALLSKLKEEKKISTKDYRVLYRKAKGGFFRSKRHLHMYTIENNMIKNEKK